MIEPQYAEADVFGTELDEDARKWARDPANRVRLTPHVKTNWKTLDARTGHAETMAEVRSARREAEWHSVVADSTDRQAALVSVSNVNRERWLEIVSEYDLIYRPLRYTQGYDGFTHQHRPASPQDPDRHTFSVVAANTDVADAMEAAHDPDEPTDHDTIGALLGFPACCREAFEQWFIDEQRVDPIYEIACNTGSAETIDGDRERVHLPDPEPWANVMYRYFGWSLLSHLPCSFDCEASHAVAEGVGEVMVDAGYRDEANALWYWLREPTTWTATNGLCHVRNQHFIGGANSGAYWSRKEVVWREPHAPGGTIIDE